ncbi:hypothetical protein PCANC_11564 [Puccinia coronata f. sp. avenae]|uniref:CUE domain-containing protein n=1 Tax=Puccinia coronata f. sp. avenae TaxID=200324 RepID=A0A2N5V7W8_9BASI|nr:hypothetical protein PCANC_11564 [Puccinia coronata f. sp. avenae]
MGGPALSATLLLVQASFSISSINSENTLPTRQARIIRERMSEDLFSVLAAIGIIALVYRWFTTSPSNASTGPNSAGTLTALQRRAMSLPRNQVDRLLTMFPQLTENEVRYALVVNRGGVEAVAERVLIRGGLEPPPPNFFPQTSSPPAMPPSTNNTTGTSSQTSAPKTKPSLIAKLNLEAYKEDQDSLFRANKEWSWEDCRARVAHPQLHSSSNDDQSIGSSALKERKARMVLESRWKMLQKDRKGKGVASTH